MVHILVVDDDANIRELVSTLLRAEGFAVHEAANGKAALEMLHEQSYSLCVLDIMMPGMDGFAFCEAVRRYYDFPILMLTALAEMAHKAKGFTLGVDDYLTKPFEAQELVLRAKALLKRYNVASESRATAGRLIVDKASFTIQLDGVKTDVPPKEFELLFLLASYPGQTLPRDRLIEEVWGYDYEGNERTLDVHVGRLRERFGPENAGIRIATVRGLGYRLEVL